MKIVSFLILSVALLAACNTDTQLADAYGNFEARELSLAAEASGKILILDAEEGQWVDPQNTLGWIDTTQLYLRKRQIKAQMDAVRSKASSVLSQIEVLESQRSNLLREKKRVENLLKDSAATTKQLDDINAQIEVNARQMNGIRMQNQSVLSELEVLETTQAQTNDLLGKCRIASPTKAVVVEKFAESGEFAMPGKTLLKLAELDKMELRAYLDGEQLGKVKLGQEVWLAYDGAEGKLEYLPATISWIAAEAEFTPKIIQTRKERVNLVYAVKAQVSNNGALKIGMPGELYFNKPTQE